MQKTKFIKNYLIILMLCAILISVLIVLFTQNHSGDSENISSIGVQNRGYIGPFLTLQVSPPGFPKVGQSWTVTVFLANESYEGHPVFEKVLDAKVFVTVRSGDWEDVYNVPINSNGEATFQYLREYDSVAFQAQYNDSITSKKVVLSTYYVPSELVDTMLIYNVLPLIGTVASNFLLKPSSESKRGILKNIPRIIAVFTFILLAFVTLAALYSKVFEGTEWGYPENIANSFVTFTGLRFIFYGAIVLLFSAWAIQIVKRWIAKKENLT